MSGDALIDARLLDVLTTVLPTRSQAMDIITTLSEEGYVIVTCEELEQLAQTLEKTADALDNMKPSA